MRIRTDVPGLRYYMYSWIVDGEWELRTSLLSYMHPFYPLLITLWWLTLGSCSSKSSKQWNKFNYVCFSSKFRPPECPQIANSDEYLHGENKTGNTHRIVGTFYSLALQWIASKFFLVNITFFCTQCNCFYTNLHILHFDDATGWSSGVTMYSVHSAV